jgi:hypothetical protein
LTQNTIVILNEQSEQSKSSEVKGIKNLKKSHTPSITTVTITVYLKENGNKKKVKGIKKLFKKLAICMWHHAFDCVSVLEKKFNDF